MGNGEQEKKYFSPQRPDVPQCRPLALDVLTDCPNVTENQHPGEVTSAICRVGCFGGRISRLPERSNCLPTPIEFERTYENPILWLKRSISLPVPP